MVVDKEKVEDKVGANHGETENSSFQETSSALGENTESDSNKPSINSGEVDGRLTSNNRIDAFKVDDSNIQRVNLVDMDKNILDESNKKYQETVDEIVEVAKDHLKSQQNDKDWLRKVFVWFFIGLLSLQLLSVIAFVAIDAFLVDISDTLLLTYITSVFVETLSVIAIMIKFSFASEDEVKIIGLLTAIVESYQYLGSKKKKKKKENKPD